MAKREVSAEKKFVNNFKLYFTAITARGISFAYFNILEDGIILTNSTTPPPNNNHGDRLTDYSVSELSFHFIHFKDKEFFTQVRNLLQIPDGVYYCINVLSVLSIMNKFKLNQLEVYDNEFGDKVFINKGRTTYNKENVIGFPIYDFHVISELFKWSKYIELISTEEHKLSHPNITEVIDTNIDMHGRTYYVNVVTDEFKESNGHPVFNNVQPSMKILCMDGLSSVSFKQFINKLSASTYTFTRYMWVEKNTYVLSMTMFENDVVKVRSIRPNLLSIPLSDRVKTQSFSID